MGNAITAAWNWFIPLEPADTFQVIVRKIICMIIGISALFAGAAPYYGFRLYGATLDSNNETLTTSSGAEVKESVYTIHFIVLCAALAIYGGVSLFVAIYCSATKTAPDWLMYVCVLNVAAIVILFDVITKFPFPARSVNLGLCIVAIGAGLDHSRLIVMALLVYTILNEVRDAWQVQMRIDSPYEGGSIEKFGFSLTGIFSLVACSVLMGGMVFEYTTLLTAARSSVELAKTVAQLLLAYDTDGVREELEIFAKEQGIEMTAADREEQEQVEEGGPTKKNDDENEEHHQQSKEPTHQDGDFNDPAAAEAAAAAHAHGETKPPQDTARQRRANESAKDLIHVFRTMAKNLDLYRPHLPSFILPQTGSQDGEDEEEDFEDETDESGADGNPNHRAPSMSSSVRRSRAGFGSGGTKDDDEDAELKGGVWDLQSETSVASVESGGGASPRAKAGAGGGSSSLLSSKSLAFATTTSSSGNFGVADNQSMSRFTSADGGTNAPTRRGAAVGVDAAATRRKKLTANISALSQRAGSFHENVIVARIDLGRFTDALLEHSLGGVSGGADASFGRTAETAAAISKKSNTVIERVLSSAAALDATVHCFIEDSVLVSWNATRRSVQTEMKCCKFLLDVRAMAGEMLVEAGALRHLFPSGSSSTSGGNSGQTGVSGASGQSQAKSNSSGAPGIYDIKSPPKSPGNISIVSVDGEGNSASGSSRSTSPSTTPPHQPLTPASAKDKEKEKEEAIHQLQRLVTGAAIQGSAWCQIGGSEKRQQFMLSRFSHTHALARAVELAGGSASYVMCPKIYARVRWEFAVQGCGAVSVPVRQAPVKRLPGRRRSSAAGSALAAAQAAVAASSSDAPSPLSGDGRSTASPSPDHHHHSHHQFNRAASSSTNSAGGVAITITQPAALRSATPPPDGAEGTSIPIGGADDVHSPLQRRDTLVGRRNSAVAAVANKSRDDSSLSSPPPERRGSDSTGTHLPLAGVPIVREGSFGSDSAATAEPSAAAAAAATTTTSTNKEENKDREEQKEPVSPLTEDALRQKQAADKGLKVSFGYNSMQPSPDASDDARADSRERAPRREDSPDTAVGNNNDGMMMMGSGSFGGEGSFGSFANNSLAVPGNNNINNPSFGSSFGSSFGGGGALINNTSFGGLAAAALSGTLFKRETVGLYELIGHKQKGVQDEWCYAVNSTDMATGGLSDAVRFIVAGDWEKAAGCLEGLTQDIPDVNKLTNGAHARVSAALQEVMNQQQYHQFSSSSSHHHHQHQQQQPASSSAPLVVLHSPLHQPTTAGESGRSSPAISGTSHPGGTL